MDSSSPQRARVVEIRLHVQLKPKKRLLQPLRPVPIPAPPSQGIIPTRLAAALTRIRLNDRGILGDALPDAEPPLVELPLKLPPHQLVGARRGEALPELPDGRVVKRLLGVAEACVCVSRLRNTGSRRGRSPSPDGLVEKVT